MSDIPQAATPNPVEDAIHALMLAAKAHGSHLGGGSPEDVQKRAWERVESARAALRAALYAAPTRARQDALEEMAEALLDELDDFLPLVDDLDCGQPVNGEEFTACELATKQRATELRRALSPADGGGRG